VYNSSQSNALKNLHERINEDISSKNKEISKLTNELDTCKRLFKEQYEIQSWLARKDEEKLKQYQES